MWCSIAAFVVIAGLVTIGVLSELAKRPKEIQPEEVPSFIVDEIQRRLPNFAAERITCEIRDKARKSPRFRMYGRVGAREIDIKVDTRDQGCAIHDIDFHFVGNINRKLSGKERVNPASFPTKLMQKAEKAIAALVGPVDRIDSIKTGQVDSKQAYEIDGWSGTWKVEVKLFASGELIEVEMKNKISG